MKTRLVVLVLAAALPLAIIGCSKKEPGELSERPAPTAVVDPSTTASITGIVKLDGPPPVFRPIDMSAEAACVQANAAPITPPVVVTGPGDALANVVVYVKSGLAPITLTRRRIPPSSTRRAACTIRASSLSW